MWHIKFTLAITLLSSSGSAQFDDIETDIVPEEAGLLGDLVETEEIEGPRYYCIFGPGPEKDDIGTLIWTEEITDMGIASTCGDSCQCWLIIDDCELEDI